MRSWLLAAVALAAVVLCGASAPAAEIDPYPDGIVVRTPIVEYTQAPCASGKCPLQRIATLRYEWRCRVQQTLHAWRSGRWVVIGKVPAA